MKRWVSVLLALLLFGSMAATAANAADMTPEQKFEVLRQKGIFTGFSDGSAGLYQSMTREQFAQVLFKLMELPSPTGSPSYKDVLKTRWSYQQIEAVREAGLMIGVGSGHFAPDSPVTIEQLAVVLAKAYGKPGGNYYVAGKVSPWARTSVGIALLNKWIPQTKDYTVTATRGLLVEASYAVYMQAYEDQLQVYSVVPIGNQQIRVDLREPVAAADKSRFQVRDVYGTELNVYGSVVNQDGRSVTVITELQVGNRSYSLYVDGVPWTYVALPSDSVKPTIVSFSRQWNSTLLLVFSEPVDRASATRSANYSLNNGLKITGIVLSDDNRSVTIATASQKDGVKYRLSVRDVKDLAGNELNDWNTEFTSDQSAPHASFKFNAATAQITVIFSEKVKPDVAVNTGRYSIDHGIAVTKAVLDDDGKTVILTTSKQQDATLYTLTVSGIPDLAGNNMTKATFQFGGVANPALPIHLQSIAAMNQNTLEVTFNRTLSDNDLSKLQVAILKDNDSNVSMTGWRQDARIKPGSNGRTAVVQFRTEGNSNPALFLQGHVYLARISGIDYLDTVGDANSASFAGTENRNLPPKVKEVIPINNSSVKIVFSEPVKNISIPAFVVKEQDGDLVKIADDGVTDQQAVVTETVLKFTDKLASGHTYEMTLRAGTVTDAAGWNNWVTKNGNDDIVLSFRGV